MPSTSKATEDRFDLRIAHEDKELIEHAATLSGQTLSAFIKSVALREARAMIDGVARTKLTMRDQQRFVEVVMSESEPTESLRAAASRSRSRLNSK
jgi:uncharacterized protein (DUF1778 family)